MNQDRELLEGTIEQQAERISDLENRMLIERNDKLAYAKSNIELAAQNQVLREALEFCRDKFYTTRGTRVGIIEEALAIPDIATPILAERDAKVLKEPANVCVIAALVCRLN